MYLSRNENCRGKVSEENSNGKKNKEKQMTDVQTKPADVSSLRGNCSRTVNPYENMTYNTTKVRRDMGSAEEMLGMRYFCANTVKYLREKGNIVTRVPTQLIL